MSLDLGNPLDFATATLSGASSLLNQFLGLNSSKWDIQESAYGHPPGELVIFHVFKSAEDYNAGVDQVQDNISRRVPEFRFPYVDGQTTDDLGREGESFDFNILIFGKNYYAAYLKLIKEFNNPVPGTLVHPVRGRMTVKFKEATVIHRSDSRKAVALRARFVEHNFEVSFQSAKPTTKSAIAAAVAFISLISNILTKIQSNLIALAQIRKAIATATASYKSNYTNTLVAINTTFNHGSSSDVPSLLPNNTGSANVSPTAFPSAETPNDPFSGITPAAIQAQQSPALAAAQATDKVKALRVQALALIESLENANAGLGALQFYDDILTLKQSALAMQKALELGLQSSNATIKNFTVPILMSVREVCFANSISVDRMEEIMMLNPDLLSANFIEKGTVLQVPTS